MRRFISSAVVVFGCLMLGACASSVKQSGDESMRTT